MSYKLSCYTLFDITYTGVLNRAKPSNNVDYDFWLVDRNRQCNLDTILQAISLRSQPEMLYNPVKHIKKISDLDMFGFLYHDEDILVPYWEFEFTVQHTSVFEDGIVEMGYLYNDCEGIPMIKCGTEYNKLPQFLDTTPELKNIHFVKY